MKKEVSAWDYLWYSLYAFGGLGLEIVLSGVLEPIIFGNSGWSSYAIGQSIVHWLLTIMCWGIMAFLLIRSSRKSLDFNICSEEKPEKRGIIVSIILVLVCIGLNAYDWRILKIIGEFQKKGVLLFGFQYLYYLFEVVLVFLIVAFGQKFAETLLKKESQIPFGGIILACTWGMIHILTQGSLYTGIGVMIFALLYGIIYTMLGRNWKWSYLAMVIAFIL